jgi:L-lactate dehydrogenase
MQGKLLRINVLFAKDMTANIMKHYTQGTILVVSNPVDILTHMIQKWSGLPAGRVIGTGTVLDSSRFRFLLSKKLNVDVKNVHGYIIGEHGDTQLPAWSATHIAGKSIEEFCEVSGSGFCEEDKKIISDEVKRAGAEIIKYKGATYYAIDITVNTILETLMKNQNTIRTVSSLINGYYGINDVTLSLPAIINSDGVERILDLNLTDKEIELLKYSAEQVKLVLNEVKDL